MREKLIELLSDMPFGRGTEEETRHIEAVAEYLVENGVTVQEWISVKDRLPESEKCVLIYSKDGKVAEGKYNALFDEWTQFRWNVTEVRNVTHWMPLPQPPKGEK